MVKLFQQDHIFQHNFDIVTSAFWRKYPNLHASHVKEIDTYARRIDEHGRLIVHRLMRCESQVPAWLQSLGVSNSAYAAETTIVDPTTRQMIVKSRNITGASMMVVEETCKYQQHPHNTEWTSYHQSAHIAAFLPFVSKKIENFSYHNMSLKAPLGLDVIEQLCQKFTLNGIDGLFDWMHMSASTAALSSSAAVSNVAKAATSSLQ